MSRFPIPVVVVSKCLGFAACRYDGGVVEDGFVARLGQHARIVTVCPELEIGLGAPRDKIRLVGTGTEQRLVQPATGRDLTGAMRDFAAKFLDGVGKHPVDGFVLKSRSPSCGLGDCKIFADAESPDEIGRGTGLFARAVAERHPDTPVEDEARLGETAEVRGVFLTRIFAGAFAREGREAPADTPFPPELL